MAVDASSLLAPEGEIELEFFPGENEDAVTERLEAYIADGEAKASALSGDDKDAAVKAWAYHRAFKTIYMRMLASPASVEIDGEGAWSVLITQMKLFGDLAAEKFVEFNEAVAETVVASPPPLASSSTPHVFSW